MDFLVAPRAGHARKELGEEVYAALRSKVPICPDETLETRLRPALDQLVVALPPEKHRVRGCARSQRLRLPDGRILVCKGLFELAWMLEKSWQGCSRMK
ncbi:MAG: hypothetical protein RMH97_06140 [Verrucomicrobiales bacterium]|nr:hypothetical protein [Verrucomicrobiales bacterium]